MKITFCLILLLSAISLHPIAAWSDTKSVTYTVSLTIPNAVATNSQQSALNTPLANQPNQTAQTQQLVRNNKVITVTSIVAE